MMEFLFQYGLFLAKTLTIIFGLIFLIAAILSIVMKGKGSEDGTLLIVNLNERAQEIQQSLQSETLSKQDFKKWLKSQKQEAKLKKKEGSKNKTQKRNRLFVTQFEGDIRASELSSLREVISAIIEIATPDDEVLVVIDSAGGFVHTYGLAASQLHRLRQHQIHLTVAIDKVAASGGYLMSCVANKIVAAPFAIVGSIGVMAQLPNFHRLLNKHQIDFELHTAGEYKRTLTLFGENTEKARRKFQEEIEETHTLFKQFIMQHRPIVNIEKVATGEHWHAIQALALNLVDEIKTSDDIILEKIKSADVFEISYEFKQKLSEKLAKNIFHSAEKFLLKLYSKWQPALMK